MLPLVNRPLVDHIIDRLPQEVDEVIMAANYLIEHLRRHFREREERGEGPAVRVVDEPEPLGTGGALKNVERFIDGTFLAFNGDVIASLDIASHVQYHRGKGGIGCLAVWRVDDPSNYGIVRFGGDERITGFIEKLEPGPGKAPSPEWINAGAYVYEPAIFDFIPAGRKVSMEREVFPEVLDRGLFAHSFTGFWVDAGRPADFLRAQGLLMDSMVADRDAEGAPGAGIVTGSPPRTAEGVGLKPPLALGADCDIGEGAMVGPHVSVGDGGVIGPSAMLSNSILLPGVRIGDGAVVSGSIIGEGCAIGSGAVVEEGCVLADGEEVGEGEVRKPSANKK
jgi:mannose-1-phosphate guanylyltransferase